MKGDQILIYKGEKKTKDDIFNLLGIDKSNQHSFDYYCTAMTATSELYGKNKRLDTDLALPNYQITMKAIYEELNPGLFSYKSSITKDLFYAILKNTSLENLILLKDMILNYDHDEFSSYRMRIRFITEGFEYTDESELLTYILNPDTELEKKSEIEKKEIITKLGNNIEDTVKNKRRI